MFDELKKKRQAIKKYILEMYNGTNSHNKLQLDSFLEFVIDNYDLDDVLFEKVKDDLEIDEHKDYQSIYELENQEYQYNVLDRRTIW